MKINLSERTMYNIGTFILTVISFTGAYLASIVDGFGLSTWLGLFSLVFGIFAIVNFVANNSK